MVVWQSTLHANETMIYHKVKECKERVLETGEPEDHITNLFLHYE